MRVRMLILILLWPLAAVAQWDTNAWSGLYTRYYLDASTNAVSIKLAMMSDATNAINERLDVLGIYERTPDAFTPPAGWYRSNRAYLVAVKAWLKSTLDKRLFITDDVYAADWIDQNLHTNTYYIGGCLGYFSGTPFDQVDNVWEFVPEIGTWISGGDSHSWPEEWAYTAVSMCASNNMPTNYFDYTPWRALVVYPDGTNGFTNATTAAGGSNFPSSRTNSTWTTTDYGWHYIDDILNDMYIVFDWPQWTGQRTTVGGWYDGSYGSITNFFATNFPYSSTSIDRPGRYVRIDKGDEWEFCHVGYVMSGNRYLLVDGLSSNYWARARAYIVVGAPPRGIQWSSTQEPVGNSWLDTSDLAFLGITNGLNLWAEANNYRTGGASLYNSANFGIVDDNDGVFVTNWYPAVLSAPTTNSFLTYSASGAVPRTNGTDAASEAFGWSVIAGSGNGLFTGVSSDDFSDEFGHALGIVVLDYSNPGATTNGFLYVSP